MLPLKEQAHPQIQPQYPAKCEVSISIIIHGESFQSGSYPIARNYYIHEHSFNLHPDQYAFKQNFKSGSAERGGGVHAKGIRTGPAVASAMQRRRSAAWRVAKGAVWPIKPRNCFSVVGGVCVYHEHVNRLYAITSRNGRGSRALDIGYAFRRFLHRHTITSTVHQSFRNRRIKFNRF